MDLEMNSGQHAKKQPSRAGSLLLSIVIIVAIVAAVTFFLRMFVFVPYEIPSGSMEETIIPGDMVFSEKISYYMREPEPNDIVTFVDPEDPSRTLIKRVIAVAGDTVDLDDGFVSVNGEILVEPYTLGKESWPLARTAPNVEVDFPYTVPEGHIWVMGDNRTSSQDSRYFGAVPISSITGRAALIYWPFNHFGLLS